MKLNLRTLLLSLTSTFSIGVSLGNKVEQSPSTLSVQEGNSSAITCTYTDTASAYFPGSKNLGKVPQLLSYSFKYGWKKDQRLTVLLNKTANYLSLHIATIQPGDSAVYLCAARTHAPQAPAPALTLVPGAALPCCNRQSSICHTVCLQVETDVLEKPRIEG